MPVLLPRLVDRDLAGLGLLGHRDLQGQHPAVIGRPDPLGVQGVAQDQLPAEHAPRALGGQKFPITLQSLTFGLYGQHVAFHIEVDRIRVHPGQVELLLAKYAAAAATTCPSLVAKHVTPHVLRHTNAMLLQANGVDIATIALWLGHENITTTQIHQHADPALKEAAIARTAPLGAKPGRYQPPDRLLAFLEAL